MSIISAFSAQPRFDAQLLADWLTPDDVPVEAEHYFDTGPAQGFGAMQRLGGLPSLFGNPVAGRDATAALSGLFAPPPGVAGAIAGATGGPSWVAGPQLPGALDNTVMAPVDQGNSKACGTSSLSMILDYYGINVPREQIDREIRRTDNGLPPQPLIDYARSKGLEAEFYNNGSWDEMKSLIGRGVAVQAQINTQANGSSSSMHWVAVVGFRSDPATGKEQIGFRDSASAKGEVRWMDRAEFEKQWAHPLDHTGYHNSFIAYGKPGTDLPPGRWDGVEALTAMLSGANNVANNWDRIFSPDDFGDFVHGLHGLPGGIVQTIGGAVGFGIQTAGDWLDHKVGKVPVLGWIARPVGQIISGVGAGIGRLFGGIGEGANAIGGAFGKLFRGDVGGFFGGLANAGGKVIGGIVGFGSSIVNGVGNAVGSVAKTVGDGVKAVGNAIGDAGKAVGKFFKSLF